MSNIRVFDEKLDSEVHRDLKVTFHETSNDAFYAMHTHGTFWEFFITTKGSYIHNLNGVEEVTRPGDAYLLRPYDQHSIKENEKDSSRLLLTVSIPNMKEGCATFSSDLYDILYKKKELKCFLSEAQIRSIMDLCFYVQVSLREDVQKTTLPSALLFNTMIMNTIEQNYSFGDGKPSWLIELLRLIQDPKNKAWRVSDVMEHANYSHSHVSRFFQRYLGCSVIDYLSEIKMQHARTSLLYSDMTIYEISSSLGYKSSTNFSAVFKGAFGVSPAEYRKKKKREQALGEGNDALSK